MDVDGTLTDGKIYMSENGELMKAFNIKDGYGITLLKQCDIIPVILTGRTSKIVDNRAAELGITHIYQGVKEKVAFLDTLLKTSHLKMDEVAYMGDDDNDLDCMKRCALAGCPSDASKRVISTCHFVSKYPGGQGAVRDFIEQILTINGKQE